MSKLPPPGSSTGNVLLSKVHLITAHKRSLGQGNIFTNMCQEFCSQGVCPIACWDTIPLEGRHPPWQGDPPPSKADCPWQGRPSWQGKPLLARQTPSTQCTLGDTVNKQAVCILLECNLVIKWDFFVKKFKTLVVNLVI